ncbi:Kunitz-type serine protease inhibitor [Trichostrongylus colubriformis]|uniref:Kunitz-type serine protease inhibitor n=1 Tax=Trichostrongylus colubriformis TaxID=6319 RepID=A0AAN8ER47_TRICO
MKLIVVLLIVFIGSALSRHDRCNEETQPGPCRGSFMRYTYDSSLGRCKTFMWGGCQPNGNNFVTMWHCLAFCAI